MSKEWEVKEEWNEDNDEGWESEDEEEFGYQVKLPQFIIMQLMHNDEILVRIRAVEGDEGECLVEFNLVKDDDEEGYERDKD